MYVYDWNKKKLMIDIYIREKADFFCIDNFGEIENRVLDTDYAVVQAQAHGTKS